MCMIVFFKKKFNLFFVLLLVISCSNKEDFILSNYQNTLVDKNCSSLDIEKRFLIKSKNEFQETNKKNYIISDVLVATLAFGAPNKKDGYSTSSYYNQRIQEIDLKLTSVEDEEKEKKCHALEK